MSAVEFSRVSVKPKLTPQQILDKQNRLAMVIESGDYLAHSLDIHKVNEITRLKAYGAIDGPALNLKTGEPINNDQLVGFYVGEPEDLKKLLHEVFGDDQNVASAMADIFHLKEKGIRHPNYSKEEIMPQPFVGPVQTVQPHNPS